MTIFQSLKPFIVHHNITLRSKIKKISCVGNRLPIFLDVLSTAIYFHSLHQTGVCLSIKTLIKHDNSIAESIKFLTKDK